ncbi:hypothetical protein [Paenibacillus xerothermodurans]|uniref:Uncharacterized protein n=1 Tax=Paenibacillus xerothermodurans TaxID=1977292 RepID=A0A2W1N7M3_PAEXE|nr:hypothetical protein [Paenibacillus xerothermodurans]PZE20407.1 hypothetical protein CBW46_013290 [Paenibacillus xerothermodurans]
MTDEQRSDVPEAQENQDASLSDTRTARYGPLDAHTDRHEPPYAHTDRHEPPSTRTDRQEQPDTEAEPVPAWFDTVRGAALQAKGAFPDQVDYYDPEKDEII